jgi:hypothetical protein
MAIEVKRVIKYPPECFVDALPIDLVAGDNKLVEYVIPSEYIYSFQNPSFAQQSGVKFYANVDGVSEVVKIDNLGGVKGLDYEEDIKIPAARLATLRAYTPTALSSFQWRYKLLVLKPTTALKVKLDLPLSARDIELEKKFGIRQLLSVQTPEAFNLHSGIEQYKTQATVMTTPGTVLRIPVPTGKKIILTNISATRPSASAQGYISVKRDGVENTLYLDPYCLQGLSYNYNIRVVALEELEVDFAMLTPGSYPIRVVYGVGDLTLKEKVMWKQDLSEEERRKAEELDLFDKVEAGVA